MQARVRVFGCRVEIDCIAKILVFDMTDLNERSNTRTVYPDAPQGLSDTHKDQVEAACSPS